MRRSTIFVASLLFVGCAKADDDPGQIKPRDGGVVVAPDLGTVEEDAPVVEDGGAIVDAKPAPETGGPCHLVINEVQTGDGSSGNADFVEILNVCPSAASVGNYKLVYRSATGATDIVLYTFPAGSSISGNAYKVIAGSSYTGAKDGALTSGLAVGGGAVGLRNDTDALIDGVGWGTATNVLVESKAASAPGDSTPAKSIARAPNGVDTDDNGKDFVVATPTPGAAN